MTRRRNTPARKTCKRDMEERQVTKSSKIERCKRDMEERQARKTSERDMQERDAIGTCNRDLQRRHGRDTSHQSHTSCQAFVLQNHALTASQNIQMRRQHVTQTRKSFAKGAGCRPNTSKAQAPRPVGFEIHSRRALAGTFPRCKCMARPLANAVSDQGHESELRAAPRGCMMFSCMDCCMYCDVLHVLLYRLLNVLRCCRFGCAYSCRDSCRDCCVFAAWIAI